MKAHLSYMSNNCWRILSTSAKSQIWARKYSQLSKDPLKFYSSAHITQVPGRPGHFEINLDQRKLKTPMGNVFQVPNEALALAVAAEWNGQKEKIKRQFMRITSLCNTAIDNPMRKTRSEMVRKICHYLGSDTLCFRMAEPEKLVKFQQENWDPVLNWFKKRYQIALEPTVGIMLPVIPDATYQALERQLTSYSDWSLVGVEQCVDSLKSLSLALALLECELEVPKAVYLSRLEQTYQIEQWGTVEWYHDIDVMESQARVAAAVLFVHLCHDFSSVQTKHKSEYSTLIS